MGSYGMNCAFKCDCKGGEPCDPITGACQCQAGITGAKCNQKCDPGFFGVGCLQKCVCQNGADCDVESGACQCKAGWHGTYW